MKHTLWAFLLIILVACVFPVLAQNRTTVVMDANTIYDTGAEYGPDGLASQDSAWISVSSKDPLTKIYLFLKCDSVLGYDAADDTVRIQMILGIDGDTTHYFDKLDTLVLFDNQIGAGAPGDSGFVIDVPSIPCDKRRYLVSVDDTISVTLTEKEDFLAPK